MTTTRQADFILSLVEARYRTLGCDTLDEAVAKVLAQADLLDTKAASIFIDRIKSLPPDPDNDMPAKVAASVKNGRNGRSQVCADCGIEVAAKAGYDYLNAGGKFDVVHKAGECSDVGIAPTHTEVTEGFYRVGSKTIMVYLSKNGRLTGKVLNSAGKYVWVAGLVQEASVGHRLTAEEAAEYGRATGQCIVCCRSLTDDRSLEVGYGKTCAGNNGWPWGAK
jgi:hypothetical protein